MAQCGYGEGWGVGRHEAGSNFFYYVRDPWGSFAEYFCDMDYIPAGCAWDARDTPPELALAVESDRAGLLSGKSRVFRIRLNERTKRRRRA